jgi:SPP1 gp7 family putative phage head morphogenesis protein
LLFFDWFTFKTTERPDSKINFSRRYPQGVANIYDVAQRFRRALLRRERSAAVELVQAYGRAYDRLAGQLEKLLKKIEAARAAGETVDQAWLLREQRYFALINQVLREIGKFADITGAVITDQQRQAVNQAMADSQRLLIVAAEASPETVSGEFNRLNKGAVENMVGFLSDGSPLSSRLNQQGPLAASVFREELTSGVIQGRGPRDVEREIRKRLYKDGSVPSGQLYSILRLARTETLRTYREASHQTYERNSSVLEGWYWLSALSDRTCRACIALHGTFHQLGERMASHIQCRCTQVPGVKGVDLGIQKGVDWFAKQPASVQREVLDKEGEYEAYKSGRLKLEDFVGLRRSAQWGDSYKALDLTRALAGEGQFPSEPQRPRDSTSLIVPREEPEPRGTPVGDALRLPAKGKLAAVGRRVVDLIARIHGDGNLPKIPVSQNASRRQYGSYQYYAGSTNPGQIKISQHGNHPEMTLAHEIGHFLDNRGVGSPLNMETHIGGLFEEVLKAAAESRAIKSLRGQLEQRYFEVFSSAGETKKYPTNRKYIRYLLQKDETWARAYAQWVALRSGDSTMLEQLRKLRQNEHPAGAASQWADDDFEPIAKAIDDLMEKLGWRF